MNGSIPISGGQARRRKGARPTDDGSGRAVDAGPSARSTWDRGARTPPVSKHNERQLACRRSRGAARTDARRPLAAACRLGAQWDRWRRYPRFLLDVVEDQREAAAGRSSCQGCRRRRWTAIPSPVRRTSRPASNQSPFRPGRRRRPAAVGRGDRRPGREGCAHRSGPCA